MADVIEKFMQKEKINGQRNDLKKLYNQEKIKGQRTYVLRNSHCQALMDGCEGDEDGNGGAGMPLEHSTSS
jgi:hypothetical protein